MLLVNFNCSIEGKFCKLVLGSMLTQIINDTICSFFSKYYLFFMNSGNLEIDKITNNNLRDYTNTRR